MNGLPNIGDQCRNRWRSILPMFGIDSRHLDGKHGPCPICEGKDRFRFDDKDGRGTFYCNQCGAGDGMKLVMLRTGQRFGHAAREIRERLGETTAAPQRRVVDNGARRRSMQDLWDSSTSVKPGDDAGRYLIARGAPAPFPPALRFCASAHISDHPTRRSMPAMLAIVTDRHGFPVNVHRTYLEGAAKAAIQAPRRMMPGEVPEGSAIRLSRHDGVLGVAEGIETALRVSVRFGIPCWSLIDAEKLRRFAIPQGVHDLRVFGDNDLNFVGQAAAFELARRASTMRDGPRNVSVMIPTRPGSDWADEDCEA